MGCLRKLACLSRCAAPELCGIFEYSSSWLSTFRGILTESFRLDSLGIASPALIEDVEFQHEAADSLLTGIGAFLFCYVSYGLLMDFVEEA